MAGVATGEGVEVRGDVDARFAEILSADAVAFVARLQREFGATRTALLQRRAERQRALDAGERPDFLPETKAVREGELAGRPGAGRPAGPAGGDHRPGRPQDDDQRPQLRGPRLHGRLRGRPLPHLGEPPRGPGQPDRRRRAARSPSSRTDGRVYRLSGRPATLLVRPRGWHLPEKHLLVDGEPVSASLFDFGLYFFHNAKRQLERGQRALLLPAQAGEPPARPASGTTSSSPPRRPSASPGGRSRPPC